MITPCNRQFLDALSSSQRALLYARLTEHACGRLARYAGIQEKEEAADVVQAAYERLVAPEYLCWDEDPPSFDGLHRYLRARVNDEVKERYRKRQQQNRLGRQLRDQCQATVSPESTLYTDELKNQWLEAAEDVSPQLGEFVLHWLERDPAEPLSVLAQALEVEVEQVYRMGTQARRIFRDLQQREVAA